MDGYITKDTVKKTKVNNLKIYRLSKSRRFSLKYKENEPNNVYHLNLKHFFLRGTSKVRKYKINEL